MSTQIIDVLFFYYLNIQGFIKPRSNTVKTYSNQFQDYNRIDGYTFLFQKHMKSGC
jgi:hypothetical protein